MINVPLMITLQAERRAATRVTSTMSLMVNVSSTTNMTKLTFRPY
jgi:hypothetical protein